MCCECVLGIFNKDVDLAFSTTTIIIIITSHHTVDSGRLHHFGICKRTNGSVKQIACTNKTHTLVVAWMDVCVDVDSRGLLRMWCAVCIWFNYANIYIWRCYRTNTTHEQHNNKLRPCATKGHKWREASAFELLLSLIYTAKIAFVSHPSPSPLKCIF